MAAGAADVVGRAAGFRLPLCERAAGSGCCCAVGMARKTATNTAAADAEMIDRDRRVAATEIDIVPPVEITLLNDVS